MTFDFIFSSLKTKIEKLILYKKIIKIKQIFQFKEKMPLLKLNSLVLKKNERILTPESIPTFVVPPTLESYRNSINQRRNSSTSTRKLLKLDNQFLK